MNRLQDLQPKKSGHPARATANSGPLEGNQPGPVIAAGFNPAHLFGRPVTRAEPAKRHSLESGVSCFRTEYLCYEGERRLHLSGASLSGTIKFAEAVADARPFWVVRARRQTIGTNRFLWLVQAGRTDSLLKKRAPG